MGSISTGIGLVSGIDIASLIDSLITLESTGKFRLQDQVGRLQAQQTALLDVNARLLGLKSTASAFRTSNIFQSVTANSSNEDILTATASTSAQPGSYKFIVKQLVSNSQKLTGGFASRDASPLGLDALSFEFGQGSLARDRALDELNGGGGVQRGRIRITDSSGEKATIDLTDVTTVNEVLDRINANTEVGVTASVRGDSIVISDDLGGALEVADYGGRTTATDLGIVGTASGELVGSDIYALSGDIALGSLNDGNGVLIRQNVQDIGIQTRDLRFFSIDLGRIDAPIEATTDLSELNDGDGVSINGTSDPDLQFVTRDGSEYDVDLTGASTVGELISRVTTQTGGDVTLSIHADGDRFVVQDNTTGGGSLQVNGAGPDGTATADDLGILNETGTTDPSFDGSVIPSSISQAAAVTLQDVIDRINNAEDSLGVANGGHIVASLSGDGRRIEIHDSEGGSQNLRIFNGNITDTFGAATDLGIFTPGAGQPTTTKVGDAIFGSLDSVLIQSLNGGSGLNGATTINISDRDGNGLTLNNLDTYETLQEIIDAINAEAAGVDAQITAGLNETGNGLRVVDSSGGTGNLQVSGDAADALGITFDDAADVARGSNVQLQYVSRATRLEDLNYGRGVDTGTFRITDGLGQSAEVNIGGTEETLYDVIAEINSRGLAVQARINDNGDGIIVEEDAAALGGDTPFVKIKIESVSGSTAADLNIEGESADVVGGFIDGSYEHVVDLNTSDDLDAVVEKINAAGIPISAAIVNTGSGPKPFHLSLTSGIAGRAGELVIDTGGIDLGLTSLSKGRDAKVFFGADTPEDGLLITSTSNTLSDVVRGVTIDLQTADDEVVTLTVAGDDESIVGAMQGLVSAFNDTIDRIKQYDFFDVDTEQKGVLLGDPTVARVRTALYRTAQRPALNVDGPFQYLSQIGVGFDGEGKMTFDEAKFRAAYESDPDGVEALVATYDATAAPDEEVAEGVTVTSSGLQYQSLGIANLFDRLLDDLTNSVDGALSLADDAFESRIDLLNNRIETFDDRLESRRDILNRQFTAMETALARIQAQAGSLGSLSNNLAIAASQFSLTR